VILIPMLLSVGCMKINKYYKKKKQHEN